MSLGQLERKLLVVVGGGGVGKTTLAAGLGLRSARAGANTLVMTFDPSLRLKDALGVDESAKDRAVQVKSRTRARLDVILLDARTTFDRLIERYAPDKAAAQRIYSNRFYRELAGSLAGILEYMAVERLFEVASERSYDRIVLDTPPTRQALDFLGAPDRIVNFLDSGAIKIALKPWWEAGGIAGMPMRLAAKGVEGIADRLLGVRLLGDMLEFFRAFTPLYDGFRERAEQVRRLLREPETLFILVSGPGQDRIPDTMFFARKLKEGGHRVGPIVVNQVHPAVGRPGAVVNGPFAEGLDLFEYLGRRDHQGIEALRKLLSRGEPLVVVPLRATPPNDLAELEQLGEEVAAQVR
jgi:anion-transporting  ArsA/GET3 family ATPase